MREHDDKCEAIEWSDTCHCECRAQLAVVTSELLTRAAMLRDVADHMEMHEELLNFYGLLEN